MTVSDISTAKANELIITPFGRAVAVYKASPSRVGLVNQQQHSKRCNNYYIHAADIKSIADMFASKFDSLLNTHLYSLHDSLHSFIQAFMNSDDLINVHFSDVEVLQAISKLKSHKSDCSGVCSEHLKLAAPAI